MDRVEILVLDFGSQYTQLIARRLREYGVYTEIVPYYENIENIKKKNPKGIILSGGPASVYEENAYKPDAKIFELQIPILGICYGMQYIADFFGGAVEKAEKQEFGKAFLEINPTATKEFILEGKRTRLRKIRNNDLVKLFGMLQDAEVMAAWEYPFALTDARKWIERQESHYKKYGLGLWVLEDKETKEFIGQVGLTLQNVGEGMGIELGYILKKDYWGMGYALEASQLCIQYATQLGIQKLYSLIRPNNTKALHFAKKLGMQKIGETTLSFRNKRFTHEVFSLQIPTKPFQPITTQRTLLRRLEKGDYNSLFKMLQDKENMWAWNENFNHKKSHKWLEHELENYARLGIGYLAIIDSHHGELIGQVGLHYKEHLELSYIIKKEYGKMGYGVETARALKEYAFKVLGVEELYCICRSDNKDSQRLAQKLGGIKVGAQKNSDANYYKYCISAGNELLSHVKQHSVVWMSHADKVVRIPPHFVELAQSDNTPFCVIANIEKKIYALQFHPEVAHSEYGGQILKNFAIGICGCNTEWNMKNFAENEIKKIRETVGDSNKVLCAVSGGVDSSVVATLLYRSIGDNLISIFVDTGLLRLDEKEAVNRIFKKDLKVPLITVDAKELFLEKLRGVTDPEKKRKIIGETFIEVFEKEAKKHNGDGSIKFLAQGTLYPDVIESVSIKGPSKTIKSHHNVGGLPEWMQFKLIEPLRELFKDEVRALGTELGIPKPTLMRHPFPGPGLAIRILGEVNERDLEILRKADCIFIEELQKKGLYQEVWQAFCVLLNVRSVGVMGDNRTYDNTLCLRAVEAVDGMTANFAHLPHKFLENVANRIINEVEGINRVVYDVTSKPPGTIEWE